MNLEDITVPFPPPVTAKDIFEKRTKDELRPARCPNAFFIYRAVYLNQLKSHNIRLRMTKMSILAGASWNKQPRTLIKIFLVELGD